MSQNDITEAFIGLVRLGVGVEVSEFARIDSQPKWDALQALATEQGLSAIVVDGLEKLPAEQKPPKPVLLQWIGEVLQGESVNTVQQKTAAEMVLLLKGSSIRTYVLKGMVIAECYPNPTHRSSADMDCYLLPLADGIDAWEVGNAVLEKNGFEVKRNYYKNSTIYLPGLTVENHKFLTPFRGNKKLTSLEKIFQAMLHADKGDNCFEGTSLCKPPVMVSALFLIEHSYTHFLHEGLNWKHVLDWVMFSKMNNGVIEWDKFDEYINEFGFRKYYDSFVRLGKYFTGDISEIELTEKDKRMMSDIWAPLDLGDDHGIKGKLTLARKTWRARWKYRQFSEISMIHALWIQVKGVLFIRNPKLD